jgi:tetratricopeptide (TPR) repeat protein
MADNTAISQLLQSATVLLKSQRYSEALPLLQSILTFDPNNEEALKAMGVAFAELKRYNDAIVAYNRALKLNQNDSSVWNLKGEALFNLGRYQEALDAFDKAILLSPNFEDAWTSKGAALSKLGRYQEALDACDKAISIGSTDGIAWLNKGFALSALGRHQEALDARNQALSINPNNAIAWNDKGVSLDNLGRYQEAVAAYDRSLKINPNISTAKTNRTNTLEKIKLANKSKKWYIGAIARVIFGIIIVLVIVQLGFGFLSHHSDQSSPLTTLQPAPTVVSANIQPVITLLPTPTESGEDAEANQIAKAIDYLTNPTVHNFALQQVQHSSAGYYNIAQICDVWQSIYNQWTYVSDPPDLTYWTSASDSINNGLKGNCADYAILNAAVIESIGGSSRVVTACAPGGNPCHAYAEVYLGNTQSDLQKATDYICSRYNCVGGGISYHPFTDAQGNTEYWLNLDWSANFPGGSFFQDDGTYHVFYPDGSYYDTTCSGGTLCTITEKMNEQTPLVAPTLVMSPTLAPVATPTLNYAHALATPTHDYTYALATPTTAPVL